MMRKKKQDTVVKEDDPTARECSPPMEYDSEPDSEALEYRRRREGFPFPEAVSLLQDFLQTADEKLSETEGLYSRPGKLLTNEEISKLDRRVLGIGAIKKTIGETMKKLEENSWKQLKSVLEEEQGNQKDEGDDFVSYLLTIVRPTRDPSSLLKYLNSNEFPHKMAPSFDGLASFAKAATEEIFDFEDESEHPMDGNTEPVPSGESPAGDGLLRAEDHERLDQSYYEVAGGFEVKKKVKKEEEDMEMDEVGVEDSNRTLNDVLHEASGNGDRAIKKELITDAPFVMRNPAMPIDTVDIKDESEDDEYGDDGMGGGGDTEDSGEEGSQTKISTVDKTPKIKRRGRPPKRFIEKEQEERLKDDIMEKKKCPIDGCTEELSTWKQLVKHMREHPRPFICGACKRGWRNRAALRVHYRKHSGEKPFECEICKFRCSLKGNLRVHQRIHDGEPSKEGDSKETPLKKRIATGERRYQCSNCDYRTNYSGNLKTHQLIHSGERCFECNFCDYSSKYKGNVKTHQRIHTGEKPYSCKICGHKTRQGSTLKTHMKTHFH